MSAPAGPLVALVDDASALLPDPPGPPGGLHGVTQAYADRARPEQGALLVRDTDLPLLRGVTAPVAVVLTGGAGQVAGPVALCARLGLDLRRLHVALRDPADLAGNARRVCTAVEDARDAGALEDEVAVHVEVPVDPEDPWSRPTASWFAAVDELAAAELGLALPLVSPWTGAAADPVDQVDPAVVVAQVDAALDREVPLWFLGATGLVGGPAVAPGVLNALVATRLVLDGEQAEGASALAERDASALLARSDPAALARVRRWCTAVAVPDPERVLRELDELLGTDLGEGWEGGSA